MSTAVAARSGVNEPGIRTVMAEIEARPQHWSQRSYMTFNECGTVYCMAAWTCLLAGLDVAQLLAGPDGCCAVYHTAKRILGLSDDQAEGIFLYEEDEWGEHPSLAQFKTRVTRFTGVSL